MSINSKKLFLFIILVSLAACQQQAKNKRQVNETKVQIPVYKTTGVIQSARLEGKLQLKNNCLYINDLLIIFPENSATWDNEKQILSFKDQNIALGEIAVIAGGSGDFNRDKERIKNLNPTCDHSYIWFTG
nr:hypothetical protein [Acinetobacter sp. Marseille-Q1620]